MSGRQSVTRAYDWKLAGISQEEDWCVVEDPIPIALVGIEFDGEATRVPRAVCGTLLPTDRGEACNTFRLFANLREHVNRCLANDQ